ncbi:MAG: DNA primase [Actinomycetota bacterium]
MAGRIRDQDIEEVRRKANLIEVASEYMQVRKAGSARFKALCPFHQEKTPSFSLEAGRGLYYCFGCNKGGDVISLVMELENLTFVEAVERLAAKVGVRLSYEQLSPKERQAVGRKQRLIAAHREAVAFYHDQLMNAADAKPAREYLSKSRGLSKDTVEAFALGWASSKWDELSRHLARKRFGEEELIEAGLALRSERGGLIDRFRGRVMFPTYDVAGEPVAFGGRVLDDSTPKYLNTADTPIFHKGRMLYGLNWAKKTIASAGRVVVVEGYTDVIALHQAGVREVVASNGTALTADHFSLIGRFAPRTVLAFDSDRAGNAAAERAFEAALGSGLDVRVLILPAGKDPADLVTAQGGEAFREITKGAVPIVEYRLLREIERFDLSDSEGRTRAVRAGIPILVRIRDEVMRRDYTSRLAEWTRLDAAVVFLEVGRATGDPTARAAPNIRRTSAQVRLERDLLKLALQYPSSIEGHLLGVDPDMLSVASHRAIWREVAAGGDAGTIVERLDEEGRALVAKLVKDAIEIELDSDGLPPQPYVDEVVTRLKDFALRRLIVEKKEQLQKLNPIENEEEYRKRYAELIALEGESKRVSGVLGEETE